MSLKEDIQDAFASDSASILQDSIGNFKDKFEWYEDSRVGLQEPYRSAGIANQMLLHLVAQRYKMESGDADQPSLSNTHFYELFPENAESTIRVKLKELRDNGLIRSAGEGEHAIVVERIPDIIELVERE